MNKETYRQYKKRIKDKKKLSQIMETAKASWEISEEFRKLVEKTLKEDSK